MKPILFEEDALNYSSNGIGVLYDTISCEVEEERNGSFTLEIEYPVDGEWFKEIKEKRLILAKPNDVDDPHVFRIFETNKSLDDSIIVVNATTITDDLGSNLVKYASAKNVNPQDAMDNIKGGLVENTRFDFVSDITTRSSSEWHKINPLNAIAGSKGSLLDIWGGEIKRTNNTVYLYSRRGKDKVTVIRPGKNIKGFNMTVSTKGLVTRILPYYEYTFNGLPEYEMVTDHSGKRVKQQKYSKMKQEVEPTVVDGNIVISKEDKKHYVSYYKAIDFSNDEDLTDKINNFIEKKRKQVEESSKIIDTSKFEDELKTYVKTQLDNRASKYFTDDNPGVDKPDVEIDVDILQLSDSPEWEKYKKLESIQLTDTVDVYIKKFDVDVEVKVSSITYDSIGERVLNIVAGSKKTSLSGSINKEYTNEVDRIEEYIKTVENGVANTMTRTADGLNRKFTGYTEPPDSVSSEGDMWFKLIGQGQVEIYIYNGGRWTPVISEEAFEEIRQDAEKAIKDADEAFKRANKAVSDAEESITKAQEGFENAQKAIIDASNADSKAQRAIDNIKEVDDKATDAINKAQSSFDKAQSNAKNIDDLGIRIGESEDNYTTISATVDGLQTEVKNKVDDTTYTSKMTQIDSVLQSVITEEDADGRYTKESKFTQTVGSLQSDISKKVDSITYKSKMTQLDNLMQTMITEEDADGRFTKQTTFNQFADSFSLRVEELEDMEIGGRNLYTHSGPPYDGEYGYSPKRETVDGIDALSWTESRDILSLNNFGDVLEEGKEYTFSFLAKASKELSIGRVYINTQNSNYLRNEIISTKWEKYSFTFTVKGENKSGKVHMYPEMSNDDGTNETFYLANWKLEKGNKATDWTPAPEDLDHRFAGIEVDLDKITSRVSDAEGNLSTVQQTAKSHARRLTDAEGNISSVTQTVNGFQSRFEDVEGDINTITSLANTNQAKIKSVEGDISSITQTANSLVSRMDKIDDNVGVLNLIPQKASLWTNILFTHIVNFKIEPNTQYVFKDYSTKEGKYGMSSISIKLVEDDRNIEIDIGSTVRFKTTSKTKSANIMFNKDLTVEYFEEELGKEIRFKLEEGENPTGWVTENSSVFSQISQLRDNINLRVEKGDVINQINIDDSGVLISGKNLILDGNTTVNGSFKVKSANIESLAASKIAVGTLDGHTLSGGNVIGGRIEQKSGFTKIVIHNGSITTYNGSEEKQKINENGFTFSRDGKKIGLIGTGTWYLDATYKGLSFALENDADYMTWAHRSNKNDNNYTTRLSWHRTSKHAEKGFNFSDNVTMKDGIFYCNTFSTWNYAEGNRRVVLANYTWNGYDGISIRRGANNDGAKLFLARSRAALINEGNAHIEVGKDGNSNYVKSIDIYNRTYTSTSQQVRVTVNGILGRSTSSRRYKLLEKKVPLEYAKRILNVDFKSWYDKQACLDYSHYLETGEEIEKEPITRLGGLIAEDVHEAGLSMLVTYDDKNRPDGLHDNIALLSFPILKDHETRLEKAEKTIARQEQTIEKLLMKITKLESA